MTNGVRNFMLLGVAAVAIVAPANPAAAQSLDASRSFDIPAQSMADAILAFSRQSNIQIVTASADLGARRSRAVRGRLTARAALDQLLAGSGLSWRQAGEGSVVVEPASGEADAGSAAAEDGSAEGAGQAGVAEILVVGNPSLNADIRRTENDVQPYVVLDQEDIRRSGATSLDDFLRTRLPQNTQRTRSDQLEQIPQVGAGANDGRIDLRGLGTSQTLILVDGRRVPGVGGFDLAQPRVTGIPLSAIERIEVLPSTAGAIYGGNAVGGVVNIVMKRDYRGIEAQVDYGNTFDGATGDLRVGLTGGFRLGSTRISFNASRTRNAPLLYGDRTELVARSRALVLANNPAAILAATTVPLGTTPNICASIATGNGRCNGGQLVLDNGTPLGASITYVPAGYPGPVAAGDGGAAFLANAGKLNLDDRADGDTLFSGSRRDTANLNIRQPVTHGFELFADLNWASDRSPVRSVNGGFTTLLQANDPANPFQQPILVLVPTTALGSTGLVRSQSLGVTGGAIVRLPHGWSLSLEQGWSRSRNVSDIETRSLTATVRTLSRPVATSDVNIVPVPDYLSVANIFPVINGPVDTTLVDSVARLGGTLLTLPAGPVVLSMLAERRVERIGDFVQQSGAAASYFLAPARRQRVESLYLEGRVPLFSSANATTLLRTLELQLSIRYDRYTTRSTDAAVFITGPDDRPDLIYLTNRVHSADYLLGARYAPVDGLTFRASYATGFLPPSLTQLIASPPTPNSVAFLTSVVDPKRGGQVLIGDASGNITQIAGGNPDLEPERSRSISLGVIVEPRFLSGLRFSADYTRIRKREEISTLGLQDLINNEDSFPGRVTRGPNLPGDPADYAGPIIGVNSGLVNLARSRVEAWDFQLDHHLETARLGTFRPYVIATHQTSFARGLLPDSPLSSTLGFANGPLRWRGNLGLDWTLGGLSVSWNMQYYGGYRLCNSTDRATTCDAAVLNQGSDRVRSQSYHDLYVRYAFEGRSFLAGTEIALGINNLFNAYPPAIAQPFGRLSTFSPYGDPRLRRFVLTLRRRFGN